jgi:MFS transporter, SP family, arabinose:H+ symporter
MMNKPNSVLLRTVMAAALGGSLLGFDTAVISGATQPLTQLFSLSPALLGITVSSALWGTIAGAMGAGLLGRSLGGSKSLMILAACYLVSALGCALSNSWTMLLVFRFIGGLGMGGSSVIAPVYIAEVAPFTWRGRLVGTFQINIIVGILIAYLSNYVIGLFGLGSLEWRWELGVAAAPAALFLFALIGIPQSPRWLAMRGRLDEAKDVLKKLGIDAESELASIQRSLRGDTSGHSVTLFQKRNLRPILLAMSLALFNQLIGINAVLYYLNDIFAMAGFDRTSQNAQAVAVGSVMLVATLLALSFIDRFGRRILLLVGSVGLAVCLAGIAAIFHFQQHQNLLLLLLIGYIASFSFSQGAVIWVYMSEIFPSPVRAQGQSLGSSTHWIVNALVSLSFPVVASYSKEGPFMVFLIVVVFQFLVVWLGFPETSGTSLEEMDTRINPTQLHPSVNLTAEAGE